MSLAWLVTLALLVAVVGITNESHLTRPGGKTSEGFIKAIAPPSWRCERDTLDEYSYLEGTCEDSEVDEDQLYVAHGGTCQVARTDPNTDLPTLESYICLYGQWSKAGTSTEISHSREKRLGVLAGIGIGIGVGVGVGLLGCALKWWCKDTETVYIQTIQKEPPTFIDCPTTVENYFTPSGQTSITLEWKVPTATDSDGPTPSVTQIMGIRNKRSFEGSTSDGGKWYDILYEAKDEDGMIANCPFSLTVTVKTCNAAPWPLNGIRNCPDDYILGSTCTYTCNEGYALSNGPSVTCQNKDNPTWSTTTTCEKVSCGRPNVTDGVKAVCPDDGYKYKDYCTMTCPAGYNLKGQVYTACEANGTWFWRDPTSCIDDVPPTLLCDNHQIFYAKRGHLSTVVTWQQPTASDNTDPNPTINKISGPAPGVLIEAGKSEYVTYIALDAEGNKSPHCTIELEVKAIRCDYPRDVFSDPSIQFNCSMGTYTYGDSCEVSCRFNLPLEGSDLIPCERNDTVKGEPTGYWDLGNGSAPYCKDTACRDLDPPLNGKVVYDRINTKPVATMLCNNKFDIPSLSSGFNGIFLCQNSGYWNPNYTKAPDCSETASSRGYRLPSQFYYNGVCNESDLSNILAAFDIIVAHLNETFNALCPNAISCYVENPRVVCGPTSRKKRHDSMRGSPYMRNQDNRDAHDIQKRQTDEDKLRLQFDITTDLDPTGMTEEEIFAFVDEIQLETLKVAIQSNFSNGAYHVSGYSEDSFETAAYGEPYCDPGSVLVPLTQCKRCPPGHIATSGVCSVCPIGQYAELSGSVKCTSCLDGYSTREDASESVSNCTELCRPGSYSPDTFVPCAPCRAGYYQPLTGQTSCIACPTAKSTKTVGSTSEADCQYFDAYLYATEAKVIEADIVSLKDLTLTFFTKSVSELPGVPVIININDEIMVEISANISIVTPSTDDVLGPSSLEDWVHVAVSWDSTASLLTASYRGDLVVSHSSIQLSTVEIGRLSITAGDAGVLISGFRLQDTVIGKTGVDTSSSSCQVVDDIEVLSMDIFKDKGAEGVGAVVPTVCDGYDECVSSPCGNHGNCTNDIGHFTCTCFGSWTGETCHIPPDFCINNDCNNGASCITGTSHYTCECPLGYTGVLCETPPVDGGWSEWIMWTNCPVTCNTGTQSRSRACNSPEPDKYGQDCQGDAIETEKCNTSPCPECPEPERGYKATLNCTTDPSTGTIECTPKCIDGYDRPLGLTTAIYTCGIGTGYKWVPRQKVPACVQLGRSREYTVNTTATLDRIVGLEEEQDVKDAIKLNAVSTYCNSSAPCEVEVDISNVSEPRKLSTVTGSNVTVSFTIPITGISDLQLEEYTTSGTVSPGLQEIIDAIHHLEATAIAINESANTLFNVEVNGVTYTVITDTLTFDGSTSCSDGQIVTNGLCAACPAGSYQNGGYCTFCDKGTYQDQVGQTSCLNCPTDYSTETIGSDASNDCSVIVTTTTQLNTRASSGETTTTTSAKPETDTSGKKVIYIGVAVGVLVTVLTGVLVALCYIKNQKSRRAMISDPRAEMRGRGRTDETKADIQGIGNPIYAHPSEIKYSTLGPKDTWLYRGGSTLSVKDLRLEIAPSADSEMYN